MVWHVWPSSLGLRCATGNLCHVKQQPSWVWNAWDNSPIAYMPDMCICLSLNKSPCSFHTWHLPIQRSDEVLATPWLVLWIRNRSLQPYLQAQLPARQTVPRGKAWSENIRNKEKQIETEISWNIRKTKHQALGDALGRSGQLLIGYWSPCLALKGWSGLRLARFTWASL